MEDRLSGALAAGRAECLPNPLLDAIMANVLLMVMDGRAREGWQVAAAVSQTRAGDFTICEVPPGHKLVTPGLSVLAVFSPASLLANA